MNMISTGAFLDGMDASKNQTTLVKKFADVWEKKNAKAARAGGLSLMALTLAACGSDSTTTTATTTTTTTTTTTPTTDAAETITLTARGDTVVTGSGDDTINGLTAGQISSSDNVDGGAGTDKLDVTIGASQPKPTIANIETLVIQSTNDAADLDLDLADTSITSITVTDSATDLDILNMQNNATFTLQDITSAAAGLTLDFDTDALGSATAALTFNTDGSTVAMDVVTTGTTDVVTTVTINTSGSASALTYDMTSVTALTTTGSANLSLISANGFTELATISGSTMTGGLTIDLDDNPLAYTVTTGSGADSIVADQANTGTGGRTITLGAGNDTLNLGANGSEADDVFSGGDGVDTLIITDTSDITVALTPGLSGFERLVLSENATLDMNDMHDRGASLTHIKADNSTSNQAVTVNNVGASVTTLELDATNASNATAAAGEDVVFDRLVDGTANSLSVVVTDTTVGAHLGDELVIDDEETVTLDTNLGLLTLNTGLSADDMTSLTVVGDNAVDLSVVSSTALATVDLSGLEDANFTASFAASTAGVTVTGNTTTGNTGVYDIIGGASDDNITGTKGIDTFTGGGGNDTFTLGTGADTVIITTAGADTITDFAVGASGDQIDIDISTVGNVVGGNATTDTAGQAMSVEFVTGAETLAAGDNILVLSGTTFSTAALAGAALEAGGSRAITLTAATTANDDILFLYSNGTDSFLVAGNVGSAATTITAANLTETTLLTLSGIDETELGSLNAANFDFI
jgi:hypothetical protein